MDTVPFDFCDRVAFILKDHLWLSIAISRSAADCSNWKAAVTDYRHNCLQFRLYINYENGLWSYGFRGGHLNSFAKLDDLHKIKARYVRVTEVIVNSKAVLSHNCSRDEVIRVLSVSRQFMNQATLDIWRIVPDWTTNEFGVFLEELKCIQFLCLDVHSVGESADIAERFYRELVTSCQIKHVYMSLRTSHPEWIRQLFAITNYQDDPLM